MQELIICRGIPTSGKSTYSEQWVKNGRRRMRVSRDDIRILLFSEYTHDHEPTVTKVEDAMVNAGLAAGYSVIVDDTNIKMAYVSRFASIADAYGVPWRVKSFDITLEEALRRNLRRAAETAKFIPEDVIRKMHKSLEDSLA